MGFLVRLPLSWKCAQLTRLELRHLSFFDSFLAPRKPLAGFCSSAIQPCAAAALTVHMAYTAHS